MVVPRRTLAGALLSVLTPILLAAQVPDRPGALRVAAGAGVGSLRLSCPQVCAGEREGGTAARLGLGIVVRRGLVLGAEAIGFTSTDEIAGVGRIRQRGWLIGPMAEWYPSRVHPIHAALAVGYFGFRAEDLDDPEDVPLTAGTVGAAFRLGYDLRLGRRVALTPWVGVAGSIGGRVSADGSTVFDDATFSLVTAGIALALP